MANRLQFEKSPYLLQHKNDPVEWYSWSEGAFAAARDEDKPILLSIGYSTCHWCHVMARESFSDKETARIINRDFIPIKVDREERPDVDQVYMAACIAMTGAGGWPLTIVMTPDQKPFWAGTYLPRKGLHSLLEQVARLWKQDREGLLSAGDALTEYLRENDRDRARKPKKELVERAVAQYSSTFDPAWGGFGRAPKFPTAHNLLFLLEYTRRTQDQRAENMAEKTLEAMYRGGLFDHIGGGFCRYSTDRQWLVPHFEKMLYDNALLLLTYSQAFQQTGRPLYRQAACRTADYVLRELRDAGGGFYCGQDADSDGVEGKYYLVTPEELQQVLSKEAAARFCRRYGVTQGGNFEGGSIPNLLEAELPEDQPGVWEEMRQTLWHWRRQRVHLHKDDKILTAWNGLMIAALARSGLLLQKPDYVAAAMASANFLQAELFDENGQLLARWREGERAIRGKLEDHAFYAWGLLELYQVTFDPSWLENALRLAGQLAELFLDQTNGGCYPYAADDEQLITRTKEAYDGAMPSGNSVAALVFSRLARLTGDVYWKRMAELQAGWLAGAASETPMGHGFTMLALLEELWPTAELVCAAEKIPAELTDYLRRTGVPGLTVLVKTPDNAQRLSALAAFTRDYPIPQQGARYYFCQKGVCAAPVDQIAELPRE